MAIRNTTRKPGKGKVWVLRTTGADGVSYSGFEWPKCVGAVVTAKDWVDDYKCGHGLHGALRGEGDGDLFKWDNDAIWWVVETAEKDIRHGGGELIGKCKFRTCKVVYFGGRKEATTLMKEAYPASSVIGGTATAGNWGTATAGDCGTATAGDGGTATAGNRGTATAGDGGTATAGDCGTATAGYGGTAKAGNWGTAKAGNRGTATAGDGGTATAGDGGILQIRFTGTRPRILTAYVGEDGIKPNVAYRLDQKGRFTEVRDDK